MRSRRSNRIIKSKKDTSKATTKKKAVKGKPRKVLTTGVSRDLEVDDYQAPTVYKKPNGHSSAVITMSIFLIVCLITSVVWSVVKPDYYDSDERVIVLLSTLFFIILFYIFLLNWVARCNNNLHHFKMDKMEFNSDMSVWWFVIPGANFFMPAKIFDELWGCSINLKEPGKYIPPYFIWTWWIVSSASVALCIFLLLTANVDDLAMAITEEAQNIRIKAIDRVQFITYFFSSIFVISLSCLIVIVAKTTNRQSEYFTIFQKQEKDNEEKPEEVSAAPAKKEQKEEVEEKKEKLLNKKKKKLLNKKKKKKTKKYPTQNKDS